MASTDSGVLSRYSWAIDTVLLSHCGITNSKILQRSEGGARQDSRRCLSAQGLLEREIRSTVGVKVPVQPHAASTHYLIKASMGSANH